MPKYANYIDRADITGTSVPVVSMCSVDVHYANRQYTGGPQLPHCIILAFSPLSTWPYIAYEYLENNISIATRQTV